MEVIFPRRLPPSSLPHATLFFLHRCYAVKVEADPLTPFRSAGMPENSSAIDH
jgi:hypothetical protein